MAERREAASPTAEVLAKFSTYGQQGKPPARKACPRKA